MRIDRPDQPAKILTIGEVLWDLFPDGQRFGGAPANCAQHISRLGKRVAMLSKVGKDPLGVSALELLRKADVDTTLVDIDNEFPTGRVDVLVDEQGQAAYQFNHREAWDRISLSDPAIEYARHANALCFGTLALRSPESRNAILGFLDATPESTIRILDVNFRDPFVDWAIFRQAAQRANVLKLNEQEFALICAHADITGELESRLNALRARFDFQTIAVTMGRDGAVIANGSEFHRCRSTQSIRVKDTVGAGDAFTAMLCVGLLNDMPFRDIGASAIRLAEYVCTQSGATPSIPSDVVERVLSRSKGRCSGTPQMSAR